ncbi:hypothetical protein VTN00DRAFT_9023 [Thermoascus crustaceus]|uniref:uncharacterized protein n=1 Tax=Thermoascus crustaceus TaxID=5088 RepID=UPI0037435C48
MRRLSPLTTTFIQSTILNAIANVLAQLIDQRKHDKPFTLNVVALIQFVIYGIIIVPPNFEWQKFIEARYPGFPTRGSTAPSPPPHPPDDDDLLPRKEKPARAAAQPSGMRNFVIKWLLDQTVGSVMNIILFIVIINFLKGASLAGVWDAIGKDFCPIMIARLKYRPVVSTLMYTLIPVDRRVVFGSACGVIWGIYLSLYAAV